MEEVKMDEVFDDLVKDDDNTITDLPDLPEEENGIGKAIKFGLLCVASGVAIGCTVAKPIFDKVSGWISGLFNKKDDEEETIVINYNENEED